MAKKTRERMISEKMQTPLQADKRRRPEKIEQADVAHVPDEIAPTPPQPGLPVIRHLVANSEGSHPLFYFDVQDIDPDTLHTAEAYIWIPAGTRLTHLGVVMIGFYATSHVAVDLTSVDQWQKLSVTARVPLDQNRIFPALMAQGDTNSIIYSSGWCVRRRTPTTRSRLSSRQTFKLASLRGLSSLAKPDAASGLLATRTKCLPDVEVQIPPISFGQIDRPAGGVTEWPPDNWYEKSYSIRNADLFTFRDAVVHGEQGIVSVGDILVAETLHFAQPDFLGFEKVGNDKYEITATEPELQVDTAAHLLCGYVGNRNYAHWWMDIVPALLVPPFHNAFDGAQLLWPKLRAPWQQQTLDLLAEAKGRSIFVGEHTRVACRELRYVPQITQSDMSPHPFRAGILKAIKERANWKGETGRRIYVSRRDARARRLLNEEAAISLLEAHGFEAVTLTGMELDEQIRLFASASHIVGAHGAGLGNILFCEAGATLLEFQMTSNVQWSIRRIAAVSRMSYGCIMGTAADDKVAVNLRDWTIDLGELTAVLDAPAFSIR